MIESVGWLLAQCFHSYHKSTGQSAKLALGQTVANPVWGVKASLAAMGAMFGSS
jgi:hypothetical protein